MVDYVQDIYKVCKFAENSSRPHDYMGSQVEMDAKKRQVLVDWLMEVHHRFKLRPETLYMETVLRKDASMTGYGLQRVVIRKFISQALSLRYFCSLILITEWLELAESRSRTSYRNRTGRAYGREKILTMEKRILEKLEWNLSVPTPYVFLVRLLKAAMHV